MLIRLKRMKGYEMGEIWVRWQLKIKYHIQLNQMAEVREQVAEIRNHIKALESTSDLQKNCRERDVIGEMIMRLLLKLDTVQVCDHRF